MVLSKRKNVKSRKSRKTKINKMKGGLPKKLDQPLDDIYYEDRIPMYLPNLSISHESYGMLKNLKKEFGIKTDCEKENNFFKKYKFKDDIKFKGITHKFKLFSSNTIASSLCKDYANAYNTSTNKKIVNDFMFRNSKNYVNSKNMYDNDYVWCKALFPKNWTCTSSPVKSVLMYQGYIETPTIVEKPLNVDDYHKIVANKITYFLGPEPKFIINCVRYLKYFKWDSKQNARDYNDFINIDVQVFSTEKTKESDIDYNQKHFPCENVGREFSYNQ